MLTVFSLVAITLALPSGTQASTPAPRSSLNICIYSIDPQSGSALISVDVMMNSPNATDSVLIGEIDNPGIRSYVLHLFPSGGSYENRTGEIDWELTGTPQNYPFDSYSIQMTVQDNSITFANGTTGAYSRISSADATFCGDNAQGLSSTWHITNFQGTVSQVGVPRPPHDQLTVTIARNEQAGLLIMLPLWLSLAFVGGLFVLEPRKLSQRLSVLMALFVFAPIYLFTIINQSQTPPAYNLVDTLVVFILITIAVEGIGSLVGSQSSSTKTRFYLDGGAVVVSEATYIALTFDTFLALPAPSFWVWVSYFVGISAYAIAGIAPLVWRLGTTREFGLRLDRLLLEILLKQVPFWVGSFLALLGAFLLAFAPQTGATWLIVGIVILVATRIVRSLKPIKRILTEGLRWYGDDDKNS